MKDITQIMYEYFTQHTDHLQAESCFHEMLKENSNIKLQYKEWCEEMGFTERKGFRSFVMNLENETIWDTIYPNKEELEEYEFFS